ncbi:hypothetical protein EVAR_43684_1 [Eumeta japonica]|uniref:Uncharacterized protein n=1 Tax=Eumeta variegata TaxID=151549 RepID=A0A4C1WYA3_EUMVA|nr:hypothetical protein EVAR_43684_1 [Eumeta japonica]
MQPQTTLIVRRVDHKPMAIHQRRRISATNPPNGGISLITAELSAPTTKGHPTRCHGTYALSVFGPCVLCAHARHVSVGKARNELAPVRCELWDFSRPPVGTGNNQERPVYSVNKRTRPAHTHNIASYCDFLGIAIAVRIRVISMLGRRGGSGTRRALPRHAP